MCVLIKTLRLVFYVALSILRRTGSFRPQSEDRYSRKVLSQRISNDTEHISFLNFILLRFKKIKHFFYFFFHLLDILQIFCYVNTILLGSVGKDF